MEICAYKTILFWDSCICTLCPGYSLHPDIAGCSEAFIAIPDRFEGVRLALGQLQG